MSDQNKVVVMLTYLTGKALTWVTTTWEKGGEPVASFDRFLTMFRGVFDDAPEGREVRDRLMSLTQGQQRMVEFVLEFQTLAAEIGWNEPALKATFHRGLNGEILVELACRDDEATLDSLIDMAIRTDNLLRDRRSTLVNLPTSIRSQAEPMQ